MDGMKLVELQGSIKTALTIAADEDHPRTLDRGPHGGKRTPSRAVKGFMVVKGYMEKRPGKWAKGPHPQR